MTNTKEPSFSDLCNLLDDPVLTLFANIPRDTNSVIVKSANQQFCETFGVPTDIHSFAANIDAKAFLDNVFNAIELKRTITSYLHCGKSLWNIKIKPIQPNHACIFFYRTTGSIPWNTELSSNQQKWSVQEHNLRVELAAAYRLFELFGWTDLIYNHLTVRLPALPNEPTTFLINPFGLLFSEITASSLVKIDIHGEIIDKGSTNFGINKAGYVIHSAIHEGRQDISCVMHCHSTAGVAVSCLKSGLVHISQNSAIVGDVSYHDYQGLAIKDEEKISLVEDLGLNNKHLILRNHGLLTCGSTIAEAFFNMYMLNRACEMQVAAFSAANGMEDLIIPDESLQKFTENAAANFNPEGIGHKEFKALLRRLDGIDESYKL